MLLGRLCGTGLGPGSLVWRVLWCVFIFVGGEQFFQRELDELRGGVPKLR